MVAYILCFHAQQNVQDEVESLFQPSGRHWAALAHEVLTATGSVHQPDALLDALLNPSTGVQGVESRGTVAAGLCYVMGYDAVLFSGAKPR